MKYQIHINTNTTEPVIMLAGNIVAASSWIANAHQTYTSYAMKVGRDYSISLFTDNDADDDYSNTEVIRHQLNPIRIGMVA